MRTTKDILLIVFMFLAVSSLHGQQEEELQNIKEEAQRAKLEALREIKENKRILDAQAIELREAAERIAMEMSPSGKITEDVSDSAKAFLSKTNPERLKDLLKAEKDDKKRFERLSRSAYRKMMALKRKAGSDYKYYQALKEAYALEYEVKKLSHACRRARGAEKTKLRSELSATVARLFDIREEKRKREVTQLEKKLLKLRNSLALRKTNKDLIVNNRIKQLLGEAGDLDWD